MDATARIAVVIPCYRVRSHLPAVLAAIGPEVAHVVCVDDACPEDSGAVALERARVDPRIELVRHERNQGVGAATRTGYRAARARGCTIAVKLDGDGQMDPRLIPALVRPIARGEADYVKGNRFFELEGLAGMPPVRLVGNAGLSLLTKLSTGYWSLFDPTNGYTAIHGAVLDHLPLDKLHARYFFESDLLFRLGTIRAVVAELPMRARYGDERSSLHVWRALVSFPFLHARNLAKRLGYNHLLRNFSVATLELATGVALCVFGAAYGGAMWVRSAITGQVASAGTVMLAGLPVLVGVQLVLSFLGFDIASEPRVPLHPRLEPEPAGQGSVDLA